MSDIVTNWTGLREFKGVDMSRSFVLSWGFESETLLVDVDLLLTPEHAFYETPRPAEKDCFRPAIIEFPWCTRVANRADSKARGTASTLDSLGSGRIDDFRRTAEGRYELTGRFGTIDIVSERPMVRLKTP